MNVDIVIPAYNARSVIQKSVRSTVMQHLPPRWHRKIIIVDDGSSDGTAVHCTDFFKNRVEVISHKQNLGRSASRNTGWMSGVGRYIVFLDADCEWCTKDSLISHLEKLESGMDVSSGAIFARGKSFWDKYQNIIQSSREKFFSLGNHATFTSANLAIRRSFLEKAGGFDEGYRHYGFEDRDLLLRLISLEAKITSSPEASVFHTPDSSLIDICRKMKEAGRHSSLRFQTTHPEYYARSSYGKIDCRLHGLTVNVLTLLSEPIMPLLTTLGDKIINIQGIPFRVKWAWLKTVSALAYMAGTSHGNKY